MNTNTIHIDACDVHKLLSAASGDAAMLYLYLHSGNDLATAAQDLRMNEQNLRNAAALLRQMGLIAQEQPVRTFSGERPAYSEEDVAASINLDSSFRSLYGEVQRRLGRTLNTEELKILLSFVRYLGLPEDVVCVLISYCQERARQQGKLRAPSLRTIEKEAYYWAEHGIDSMEAAGAFIQAKNVYNSRLQRLMRLLQIRGRALTAAEEKYAALWLDWGMSEELLTAAYERTCLNTGSLSWAYMHKILTRWHDAGITSASQLRTEDRRGSTPGSRTLDSDEQAAIARLLKED